MTDDFNLPGVGKVNILDIYEKNNTLRIIVETRYGKRNIGLGLDKKYINPETGIPRWMGELKTTLKQLYDNKTRVKKDLKDEYSDFIGEIAIEDLGKPGKKAKKLNS